MLLLWSAEPALAGDLGGEWHFDALDNNATADSSGNGNDLTGEGQTTVVPGRFGNAFDFGSGGALRRAGSASLEPQQITVMAWVKASAAPQNSYLVAKGAAQSQGLSNSCYSSYALWTDANGQLSFYIDGSAGFVESPRQSASIWDGNWHAVAGTYDGSTTRLYVDGQQVGGGTSTASAIDYGLPNTDFTVAQFPVGTPCGGTHPYGGQMDELRVYDRALSDSEVNQLQTAPGDTPPELGGGGGGTGGGGSGGGGGGGGGGSVPPIARIATGVSGVMKGGVWFNGKASTSVAGSIVDYQWDPQGDGKFDLPCGVSPALSMRMPKPGDYNVGLQVTDAAGQVGRTTMKVHIDKAHAGTVGNTPVFDCENPGANNQPDRADCVKSFGFGLVDANSRGQAGDCFHLTARQRGGISTQPHHPKGQAHAALSKFYFYNATLQGPVALNGIFVPVREGDETVWDSGDQTIKLGRVNFEFGKFHTFVSNLKTVSVKPNAQGYAHLADLPLGGKDKGLLGFPVTGDVSFDLFKRFSRTTVHVALPKPLDFGPLQTAQGNVYLISNNEEGTKFDGAKLGPLDVMLGPVTLKNLQLTYIKSLNRWSGGAKVFFPFADYGLDAAPPPPDLGVGFTNGRLDHVGLGLEFPVGAQPQLFPGVGLHRVHAAFGDRPLRFTGGIGIESAGVYDIDGDVFIAFASPKFPYDFPSDTGGSLAPFAGRHLDSFSIAVGGTASLHLPFGTFPLADAYGLYESPDFFEVGAGFKLDLFLVKLDGNLNGFVLPSQDKYSFGAQVQACPDFKVDLPIVGETTIDSPCFGAGAAISTAGVGVCGTVPIPFFGGAIPVTVTVGAKWGHSIGIALFKCQLSDYQEANPRGSGARAGQARAAASWSFKLPSGLPSAMVRIDGQGGSPDVTLRGPGKHVIDTAHPPNDHNVIVIREENATLIALKSPAGGSWSVAPDSGSVPVTRVASADGMPNANIKASVSGHGATRTLKYRLRTAPGRVVRFAERGARTYHVLGKARGSKGSLRFTPAIGRAEQRKILAIETDGGIDQPAVVVTHYRASELRPAEPRGLRVARKGSKLVITFSKATNAATYQVLVSTADGARTLRVTKARRVQVPVLSTRFKGTVTVTGVSADGTHGPAARKPFRGRKR